MTSKGTRTAQPQLAVPEVRDLGGGNIKKESIMTQTATSANIRMATKQQKTDIRRNCNWNIDIKEEWVQWATEDVNKTSLNDLTYEQAEKILNQQVGKTSNSENWARFNKRNGKHMTILSLLRQADWTEKNDRYGEVADLNRLSDWLKSEKSPVRKPLLKMDDVELEKIIKALRGIVNSKYRK